MRWRAKRFQGFKGFMKTASSSSKGHLRISFADWSCISPLLYAEWGADPNDLIPEAAAALRKVPLYTEALAHCAPGQHPPPSSYYTSAHSFPDDPPPPLPFWQRWLLQRPRAWAIYRQLTIPAALYCYEELMLAERWPGYVPMPLTHQEVMSFWLAEHWGTRVLKMVTFLGVRKAWEKRRQWRLAEDRVVAIGKQAAEAAAKGKLPGVRSVEHISRKQRRQYYLSRAPQYMREQLYRPVQGAAVYGDLRVRAEAEAAQKEERRQVWQQKAEGAGDWVEAALAATYAPGGINYGKWGNLMKGTRWWPFTWGWNLRWFMPDREPHWVVGARKGPTGARAAWEVEGYDARVRREEGFRVPSALDMVVSREGSEDDRSECQEQDQQLPVARAAPPFRKPAPLSAAAMGTLGAGHAAAAAAGGFSDQGVGTAAADVQAWPAVCPLTPATASAAAAAHARALRFFNSQGGQVEQPTQQQQAGSRELSMGTGLWAGKPPARGKVSRTSRGARQKGMVVRGSGVHCDADDESEGSESGATKVHVLLGVSGKEATAAAAVAAAVGPAAWESWERRQQQQQH